MIRNYFKIAFRNITRNKVFSFINILGLAIGLAVSIIILVYVRHELSYDKFHSNSENIYRLGISQAQGESITLSGITSPASGPDLYREIPDIKNYVRISTPQSGMYSYNNEELNSRTIFADSTFFEIFSFQLLVGDASEVLKHPYSVVLTESYARKLFKEKNPLGMQLTLNSDLQLMVTGIAKDVPTNSHLKFDALVSLNTFTEQENFYNKWDGNYSYYTYIEIVAGSNINDILQKSNEIFDEKLNVKLREFGWNVLPIYEPLNDLYLNSIVQFNAYDTGSKTTVKIFIVIAIFILVIACINFMNLSSSLIIKRVKEVAIRKVIGAGRRKIIAQFLNESVLLSLIALIVGLIFIEIFMPSFNQMFQKELGLYRIENLYLIISIPLLVILIGVISGSYPALIMSGFKPVNLMKGLKIKGNRKLSLQNILVVLQFVISTVLIICTTIIYFQINFLTNKDLGFKKDNLIVVSLYTQKSVENSDLIRDRFLTNPSVINSTVASNFPARGLTQNGYRPEGDEKVKIFHALYVDYNYINTMGMEIIKGRDFDPEMPSDKEKLIVNEALVKQVGWDDPIGKYLDRNGRQEIIGVVKDFHFQTLHQEIGPLVITMYPRKNMIISKIKDENKLETISFLEKQWKDLTGEDSFNYFFVKDTHEKLYSDEKKFGDIILSFSILAIFIACMGLFGLTAFITAQRTKEIGIRKVLGASPLSINKLILKQFLGIVFISIIISWPIAYYAMTEWLSNYAYKINIHLMFFVMASVIAIIIAFLTLTYNTLKASTTNPVDSLKYE